jgi:RNA-splicing ligase RtcB
MLSLCLGIKTLQMSRESLDKEIRNQIGFGKNINENTVYFDNFVFQRINVMIRTFVMRYNFNYKTKKDLTIIDQNWFEKKCDQIGMNYERFLKSIGTLGGGNHFIEFGVSENTENIWFTIHSGSRQFGLKIAEYWQRIAGKDKLSFLVGDDAFNYLIDMIVAQEYAHQNRKFMAHKILNILNINAIDSIETIHNYVNFKDFIIRKGAISSYKTHKMIIPLNMEDGIIICEGKSNPEWNFSAPHGAGRIESRGWCKKNLNLEDAKKRMDEKGIFASALPIDELRGAYKDPQIIIDAIEPTATIIDKIKPIMACKDEK